MQELTENLRVVIPLTYEERETAYEKARNRLAGTTTDIRKFRKASVSKYPRGLVNFAYVLLGLLMLAAFIPSAISLYHSGNREFCRALAAVEDGSAFTASDVITEVFDPTDLRCVAAGGALVAMAEVGQLVFLISLSILSPSYSVITIRGRERAFSFGVILLWTGALLSTLIAIVGNAHFGQPWKHGNWLFDYIKTFVPPFLVMAIGYTLKEMFLNAVRDNFEVTAKFNEAEEVRLSLYNNPELSKSWNRFLSYALREELITKNKRAAQTRALKALSEEEWRYLIRTEYSRMNWQVDLEQESAIEKVANVEKTERDAAITSKAAIATAPEATRKEGDSYAYWPNEDGTWSGFSKITNTLVGESYASGGAAYRAVRNHNQKNS